ncbi:uncharacterized protein DUF4136 [Alteromonadaceae bacterium 2753L.S.0a.02]|nr:uncharacterized protein DUF4136 [Alteromonadaceae bacterium 2753L.S.0a.02]
MKLIISFTALLTLFLAGCSSSPTTSMTDPEVDFSQYKTYGFIEHPKTDEAEYETLITSFLKSAAKTEMEKRGFSYSENPDVKLNFSVETEEKIRAHTTPSMGMGMGYDPFYDVYYDNWRVSHQTHITQYTEGRLNIDVIDVAKRKLVWQGTTKGRLTQKALENPQESITDAVAEVFTVFPVVVPE